MEREFKQRQIHDFFRDFSSLGNIWFYLIVVLFFMIFENKAIANKLLIGLVLIYALTIAIRSFYFKERPTKYSHSSYIEKIDASSFPSLHSARIVFLSIFLMNYFEELLFSVLLVILAIIVVYSRIYLKKHDFSDVSAGAILGAAVYFIVNALF